MCCYIMPLTLPLCINMQGARSQVDVTSGGIFIPDEGPVASHQTKPVMSQADKPGAHKR